MVRMSRLYPSACSAVPPVKLRIPGAPPMAKPPQPTVSVMAESPMSSPASASVHPGRNRPCTRGEGAVNHSPSSPLTWMPKSVPLRAMAVTRVLASTPRAGSAAALPAAMDSPRNRNGWLPT